MLGVDVLKLGNTGPGKILKNVGKMKYLINIDLFSRIKNNNQRF